MAIIVAVTRLSTSCILTLSRTNFIIRLNEGHTVFVERKIASRMHDEQFRHFAALGGWKDLFYQVILPTRWCLTCSQYAIKD